MTSTTNSMGKLSKKSQNIISEIKEYILMGIGVVFYVIAWKAFLLPYTIVGGGATGICAIVYFITENILGAGNGIPIWLSFLILNTVLLVMAIRLLGLKFCIRTIYSTILMTLLFRFVPQAEIGQFLGENDSLLACILGGIMCGGGLAINYSSGGSTGGTDIIAAMINKRSNITLGRVLLYCDLIIISSSYFIGNGITPIIYGLVNMTILSFSVDMMMNGRRQYVQFFIFSPKFAEIADTIHSEVGRGVTLLDGTGWYSKQSIKVITVLVRKNEALKVFKLVHEIDPNAFVSQSAAAGVYGAGFEAIVTK